MEPLVLWKVCITVQTKCYKEQQFYSFLQITVLQSKIRPKTEYEIMARINFNSLQDKGKLSW